MVENYSLDKKRVPAKTLNILPQTGKIGDIVRDRGRLAKLPGKRVSKTGKTYWETRKNRSDAAEKRT